MFRRFPVAVTALTVGAWLSGVAFGAGPASKPGATTQAGGDGTAMEAYKSYSAAVNKHDMEGALKYCYTGGEKGQAEFAHMYANADADFAKIRKTAVRQLGPKANEPVAQVFRELLVADADKVTTDPNLPDRAEIQFPKERTTVPMIQKEGHWKLDIPQITGRMGMQYEKKRGEIELRQNAAAALEPDIAKHKPASVEKLIEECYRRIYNRR